MYECLPRKGIMQKLDQKQFDELMGRVRGGDESAAAELLSIYEPEIRRDIRLRLTNRKLRRLVDSIDISQSVFGNFFLRAVHGEFKLERPEQLLGLLSRMATNKVIDRHRHEKSRRLQDTLDDPIEDRSVISREPTASQIVSGKELVGQFQQRLSEQERQIAELRRSGSSWNDIAISFGENSDAIRKRLQRACNRVMLELGF